MMRLLALGVAAMLVAPAMADPVKVYDMGTTALDHPIGGGPRAGGAYSTGFEAADSFAVGWLSGQAGWTGSIASVVDPAISAANPAAGAQHLRLAGDSSLGVGTTLGGWSPNQGVLGAGHYTLSVDVNVSATGGADYDIVPQAPSQGFLSARVKFDWLGNIKVLDSTLTYATVGTYTPGAWHNVFIDMDSTANSIDYYIDGGLVLSDALVAGTSFEEVVLLGDNWNAGDTGDFDNLVVTPEPATLALLSFGALALIRRRR